MKFFLFFVVSFCEIFNWNANEKKSKFLVFDVTGHQICKGFFKPEAGDDVFFSVLVKTEDGSIFYQNDKLETNKETHFSFNITENRDLICEMKTHGNSSSPSKFEVKFDTQFDTFRKDIAKQVRVEPAMYSLTKLDNLLSEINLQTDDLSFKMGHVDNEYKRMFLFSTILSIGTLIIYVSVQGYLLHSMRNFFKNKKLI